VIVDRTPPAIQARRSGPTVEITVTDTLTPVARLEVVRDGRVLYRLRPSDGVADSRSETYRFDVPPEAEGAALRATDAAGNVAEAPLPTR
jgi:hypothetical protein